MQRKWLSYTEDVAPGHGIDRGHLAANGKLEKEVGGGELSQVDSFTAGELVGERFRIVRLIGRGGMGEVYEADDLELRERVALKTVLAEDHEDSVAGRRFRREVQLARKVTHPNVCRVFDVFRHHRADGDGHVTFVTMELLPGSSLDEHLADVGTMTEDEAEPLVLQMAEALAAAHQAGIIHRDFKPSNVMLVPTAHGDTRAVVTDFGLARSLEGLDDSFSSRSGETGIIAGSVHYMAPEQAMAEQLSPATDIYALGVVMFEMVTAARPHRAASPAQLLINRICDPAPSPHDWNPDLDATWERVIMRCLELKPEDRYADVGELVSDLAGARQRGTSPVPTELRQPPSPGVGFNDQTTLTLPPVTRAAAVHSRRWLLGLASGVPLVTILLGLLYFSPLLRPLRPATNPYPVFNPMQLTTSPGLDIDPSFDPDGETLAFSSDRRGRFEIFFKELTPGTPVVQLTTDGQQNFQPAWSPDGKRIAYYSASRGGIWMVTVGAGGSPRQVTNFGSQPAWSPDGQWLALQSEGKAELSASSAPALPPSTIWVVAVTETPAAQETVQVTTAAEPPGGHGVPAWSPDGKRLAFSTYRGRRSEIWSVAVDGSALVPVVRDQPACFHPVYTPDGRHLLYSAVAEGERHSVWSVAVSPRSGKAVAEPVQLATLGPVSIRQLAVSATGDHLAYTALTTRSNLVSLSLDPETSLPQGQPIPLTSGSGRNNRPSFSPDGTRVTYDSWRVGVNPDIWIVNAGGGDAVQLTNDPATDSHASWFPSGDRLAFLSRRDGGWALWSRHLETAEAVRLGELGQDVAWAQLSPDGRRVAYHSREGSTTLNLWTANPDGSDRLRLTADEEFMGFPCWSPDGEHLAFEVKRGQETHVMVMPASGGEPIQLTRGDGQSWPNSWSPGGDKIAFSGQRDGFWNIWWISHSSGELQQLTSYQRLGSYVRYPAWSPNGDRVVFELAETTGDIWLVETS
jgi:Tol biopolymer transport system component/tRNA A-37 threonylcarbamoyl transferase component Bud32